MTRRHAASAAAALILSATLVHAAGVPGSSAGNPYEESNAGRAWQRITFGAIDCGADLSEAGAFCPNDAFSKSGLFVNGTYRDIRFVYAGAPAGGPNAADYLGNRVINQSQTFPQASSASGFTFTWNGPTPTLDSEMFGPLFGNRGRTNGRGKLSATLSVQTLKWAKLDGSSVRNGEAGLDWGDHAYADFGSGPAGYVGRCRMDIDSLTASAAFTYGITDRLDVSAGIPIVHTTIEGSNEFIDYVVLSGGRISIDPADTGFAPQGRFHVKGSSTGIGDAMVGVTYALTKKERSALAFTGRVNLGTGSFEKMTGTGETQWSFGVVGSHERKRFAPHFSASYFGANDDVFDEARGVLGLDVRAVPNRLTLSAELLARRLMGVQGFTEGPSLGTVRSPLTGETMPVRNYVAGRDDHNLYFTTVGGKWRAAGQLLITGFVLVPFGDSGLIAQKPSWNLGANYAF